MQFQINSLIRYIPADDNTSLYLVQVFYIWQVKRGGWCPELLFKTA